MSAPRYAPRPPRALDFAKMLPTGEMPSPRHAGRAAVFLASDDSEVITGFDLGATAKYGRGASSAAAGCT
jgi:hypothetical protein